MLIFVQECDVIVDTIVEIVQQAGIDTLHRRAIK